jgi:hypothetical protein
MLKGLVSMWFIVAFPLYHKFDEDHEYVVLLCVE